MKRRFLLSVVVAVGLLAGALPAQAGNVSWTDPEADATAFLVVAPVGLAPNDPALDVTKVTISSDASSITWKASVKKLAEAGPTLGGGYFFRFQFVFEGGSFALRARKDSLENTLQFRLASDNVGFDLPCKDCKATFDFKGSSITVKTPIASLAEGIKAADDLAKCTGCRVDEDPLPAFKKGAQLKTLQVTAQRVYVRTTPTADEAKAPADLVFDV